MTNQNRELRDQVAIVTGAGSGIGAAAARELARRGARLVLAGRRPAALDRTAESIRAGGGEAIAVPTDVCEIAQIGRLVAASLEMFGRLDVVVNSAGIDWNRPFAGSAVEEIRHLMAVNLLGAMLLSRAALPAMLTQRRGAIISVGSVSGRVAMEPLYSASKFGLRGFSLALRRQLDGSGVTASLVSPGRIRTPMTANASGRLPDPELVARVIARLVSRPRREVVVPRRHYAIAWLEQGLPALADRAYRWRHWSPVP